MEETLRLILDKLNNMDAHINSIDTHINSMDTDIKDLKKHVVVIENKLDNNFEALFDGYKQTYENTIEIKKDIKDIKDKLDIHETKLLKVK